MGVSAIRPAVFGLREEARRAAKIASDHVADVIACGVDEATGAPYVAMDLARGESLAKRVDGLIHRDLKPEGIILADSRSSGGSARVVVQFVGLGQIASEVLWGAPR